MKTEKTQSTDPACLQNACGAPLPWPCADATLSTYPLCLEREGIHPNSLETSLSGGVLVGGVVARELSEASYQQG